MTTKPAPVATSCPVCGSRTEPENKPFCSTRCRQADLGRWLSGSYVIPGDKVPDQDDGEES